MSATSGVWSLNGRQAYDSAHQLFQFARVLLRWIFADLSQGCAGSFLTMSGVSFTPHPLPKPGDLFTIDVDSPFVMGIGRNPSDKERKEWGLSPDDARPMSILGLDKEGCAVVSGHAIAKLFAAAPELLEACVETVAYGNCDCDNGEGDCVFCLAEKAVKKAKGES